MGDTFIEPNPGTQTVDDSTKSDASASATAEETPGVPAAEVPPTTEPAATTPAPSVEQPASVSEPALEPGEPIGDKAPKLAELQNQLCPNCTTGVLEVTRYDPDAIYERGQGDALAKGAESGGAYDVRCRNCDYTASHAFNPGPQHGVNV